MAVYLGLNAEFESPTEFLARLRRDGLPMIDDLPQDADVAAQMLHQEKQLGPILRATVDRLVAEIPAAGTVLGYASLLPPDVVPWPWLRELATADHPELATPAVWGKLKRRLEGTRLIASGDASELGRMHRLVAAHLQVAVTEELAERLRNHCATRCYAIEQSQATPAEWELDGLLAAVPHLLKACDHPYLAQQGTFLTAKVVPYRSLTVAQGLLDVTHAVTERRAASDPGNAAWQRDLSVSLERLGDVATAQGNLPEAQRRFAASLAIAERLAASDPGNAEWQRDLSVSLGQLGNLATAQGNLSEAQRRFAASLAIAERLAASDPGNAAWQRDLSVSYFKLAQLAEQAGDDAEQLARLRDCYAVLNRMRSRDLHFDPPLERVYDWLAQLFGDTPTA